MKCVYCGHEDEPTDRVVKKTDMMFGRLKTTIYCTNYPNCIERQIANRERKDNFNRYYLHLVETRQRGLLNVE